MDDCGIDVYCSVVLIKTGGRLDSAVHVLSDTSGRAVREGSAGLSSNGLTADSMAILQISSMICGGKDLNRGLLPRHTSAPSREE
jgi:hypothetical protein